MLKHCRIEDERKSNLALWPCKCQFFWLQLMVQSERKLYTEEH